MLIENGEAEKISGNLYIYFLRLKNYFFFLRWEDPDRWEKYRDWFYATKKDEG